MEGETKQKTKLFVNQHAKTRTVCFASTVTSTHWPHLQWQCHLEKPLQFLPLPSPPRPRRSAL